MADIRPLRGFRYNPELVPDLSEVVTPPYDVISPEQQARYHERHPLNIIQLELGTDQPGDDSFANRYTRAAAIFAQWRLDGSLRQEPESVLYVYEQKFHVDGQHYTRTSLLARVRLEPWDAGVVLPHEHTLAKPKGDRLSLLRATSANLSPIMSLFDDPDSTVNAIMAAASQGTPVADLTDDDGEGHRLWLISDEAMIREINEIFAGQQLFIADGHHRYETALTYREDVRELHRGLSDDDAANFVLMALVATEDPGLVVLPTHRLVRGLDEATIAAIPEKLQEFWSVESLEAKDNAESLVKHLSEAGKKGIAAIVLTADQRWLAHLDTAKSNERMRATHEPEAWQALDVAVAHELIVDTALGLPREAISESDQISYTRDAAEALEALASGKAQVAILLNPTRPEQVRDVAKAGGRMPQKSTFFYPKLITGLVINPVW